MLQVSVGHLITTSPFLAKVLVKRRRAWALHSLSALLLDGRGDCRRDAATALGQLGLSEAVGDLIEVLKVPDVTTNAIWALQKLGDPRAIEALVPLLENQEQYVREAAARALRGFGWQPSSDREKVLECIALGRLADAASYGSIAAPELSARLCDYRKGNDILSLIETNRNLDIVEPLVLAALSPPNQRGFLNGHYDVFKILTRAAKSESSLLSASNGDDAFRQRVIIAVRGFLVADHTWRSSAVVTLDALGWVPKGEYERTLHSIALSRWDDVNLTNSEAESAVMDVFKADNGTSGIGYILQRIATSKVAGDLIPFLTVEIKGEIAFRVLVQILKREASEMPSEHLIAISEVPHYIQMVDHEEGDDHPWYGRSIVSRPEPGSCAELTALAKTELLRRSGRL